MKTEENVSTLEEPLVAYGMPTSVNPTILVGLISRLDSVFNHLEYIKETTESSDATIAYWLNVNVKTYRNYRTENAILKPDVKEHLIMLASIAEHGLEVFGTHKSFSKWLKIDNFMLGGQKPTDLLNTNSGVRLVNDRLTGMEYGDNA